MATAKINNTVVGWDEVQTCAIKEHSEYFGKVQTIADVLNISKEFAAAVVYLRTQDNYCQELEDVLVDMYKQNESVPSMLTWGR